MEFLRGLYACLVLVMGRCRRPHRFEAVDTCPNLHVDENVIEA
jgi:hypothetical protein